MNNYQILLQQTEIERQQLFSSPVFLNLQHKNFKLSNYIKFLKNAYHHVKETVPLLMLTGALIPHDKEFFRKSIVEYINEEYGHHYWILNDIKNSGCLDHVEIENSPIDVQIMVSYVKDMIYKNPMSFFGMVLVLEGTSTKIATNAASIIKEHLKLKDDSFSYLTSHGELDLEHIVFYEKLINTIKDTKDLEDIIQTAKYVYILYKNVLENSFKEE